MTNKPLALFVTPVVPLPSGSGRALRAWDWLQSLSLQYRVHLLITAERRTWPPLPADYPAEVLWPLAERLSTNRRFFRLGGLLLPLLAAGSRRFVSDWQRWQSTAQLDALAEHWAGETVARIVVFRLYLHDLGEALAARYPKACCDLDLDDLESSTRLSVALASWRIGHYCEALRGLAIAVQYRLVERGIAPCYQHLYLAAAADAQHLPSGQGQSITHRPNRIALPAASAPLPDTDELGLLFVGTLNYAPNEEAVRYLVQHLVPALRSTLNRPWRLRIVGRHASAALQALLRAEPQVEFCANAERLDDSYARSHIVLVPLFAGGGTKLKTLEGFAHQRPVIASGQGVRGLDVTAGVDYLAAETTEQFAAAVRTLATEPALAERIACAGRVLCQSRYSRP